MNDCKLPEVVLVDKNWDNKKSADYWDNFYKSNNLTEQATPFAKFCLDNLPKAGAILELGCGNGRDAVFFASLGYKVIACDVSKVATDNLQNQQTDKKIANLKILNTDFSKFNKHSNCFLQSANISAIYSRFSLHAVDSESASRTLKWCFVNLPVGGKLCIEVRSIFDELYGDGVLVGEHSFVTCHFRRFFCQKQLEKEIVDLGFKIDISIASRGFAPYKSEDPIIIRVIASKSK